ncbi:MULTISPECIES: aldehyde dehydrogenase family protein [Paraburkholderia]|uniref:aldehyde dehydrogenase family protein n=1 Tax=Paraburkholderia TaxID=1822464 RepID=UPI002AB0077F|nr:MULTISPECIES: aldehyde dehydrogenase family protein [Paraburkholderia]
MLSFEEIFERQKAYFATGRTRSFEWRKAQLSSLEALLRENEGAFYEALGMDFKKAAFEQYMEVHGPLATIANVLQNLQQWMEPETAEIPGGLAASGHQGKIFYEPYGVTLVIGPFNAPLILLFEPVIAALSAGNTVIAKPSEATSYTSELLLQLVPKYFEAEVFALVAGAKEAVIDLLALPFDFIAFTGSEKVGKIVMRAAAEHLTPVLLELGGQNCAVVDETANIEHAATQLAWGATAISGQWCVSPGYVFVHSSVAGKFVQACKTALLEMYGSDARSSPDYSRMKSPDDVRRIAQMTAGASVAYGGRFDVADCYIEPTIIYPARRDEPAMCGEIFGPVLPVLPYDDLQEVIQFISAKPKALAGYMFSNNAENVQTFLDGVSFGGGCVNNTNIHCWLGGLPFGGVGPSGIGKYFGKHSFTTFSNRKSMLLSPSEQLLKSLYPPYSPEKLGELGSLLS